MEQYICMRKARSVESEGCRSCQGRSTITQPEAHYSSQSINPNPLSVPSSNLSHTSSPTLLRLPLPKSLPSPHQLALPILYRCMLYTRKHRQRSQLDDCILLQQLSMHISICSMPVPRDAVGQLLLRNGYVGVAYAVLMARLYRVRGLFGYYMGVFQVGYDIDVCGEEFGYYLRAGEEGVGLIVDKPVQKSVKDSISHSLKRSHITINQP